MQVNSHAHIRSDFSPSLKKTTLFRPPNHFQPYIENKSYSIPRTKIKSIWTSHKKWSQASRSSEEQVIFGVHTTSHLPHTKQFDPATEINSSSIPHTDTKYISTTTTKTKTVFVLTLKTSHFRDTPKRVNFGPLKNK